MDKNNSFFNTSVPEELSDRIKAAAQKEFKLIAKRQRRRRFAYFFLPALTTVAATFFIFQLNIQSEFSNPSLQEVDVVSLLAAVDQSEIVDQLAEEEDSLEMIDELGLIEEMDNLSLISDEELEG